MLKKAEVDKDLPSWIHLLECDICGQRFSSTMKTAWPFCSASIPHKRMESKEQISIVEKLKAVGDRPFNDYIRPAMELKSTGHSVSWLEEALPSMLDIQEVRLMRETFARFRDHYFIQGYFIGNVLGKYNWSMLDLIEFSLKNFSEKLEEKK